MYELDLMNENMIEKWNQSNISFELVFRFSRARVCTDGGGRRPRSWNFEPVWEWLSWGYMKTNEVSKVWRAAHWLLRIARAGKKRCLCCASFAAGLLGALLQCCISNPTPTYLCDVAHRIGLASAPLRGGLCFGRHWQHAFITSPLQISMLARARQLALAPGAHELLLCIEWRHYHCPGLALWHRFGLIMPCGRINSRRDSVGEGREGDEKAERGEHK